MRNYGAPGRAQWYKFQPNVNLAKVRIGFSPHILDFKGVEKGLNPRLFLLSVIPAKEGVDCKMDTRLREDDGGEDSTFATTTCA